MMIYAADSVGEKDLTEYNGTYRKEYGDLVMELDGVFTLFGFSYSKEEFYKVAEGSHEFYEKR